MSNRSAPGTSASIAQPGQPGSATPALPPHVQDLLEKVLKSLSGEFKHGLDHLLSTLEQDLFRQAERARNNAVQAETFHVLRNLRQHRDELTPAFLRGFEAALGNIRNPASHVEEEPATVDFDGLRLVDDSEISEDVLLRSIAKRHESRCALPLMLLGQRFGVLAAAPAFPAAALPMGPQALCRLLAEAASVLKFDINTRLQLFRLYDQQLVARYEALVDATNTLLSNENVLPGLTFVPLRRQQSPQHKASPSAFRQQPTASEPQSPGAQETGEGHASHAASATPGFTGGGSAPGAASGNSPDDAALSALSQNESETLALVQRLLAERRELLDKLAPAAKRAQAAIPASDVDNVLGALQTHTNNFGLSRGVANIRQALLDGNRKQHGKASVLSREDSDTFELLGLLYSEIGRELSEDTPSTELLDRLQVPLLRVALKDREFFVRQQHPARQLLDAVAEAGAVQQDEDEKDPQLDAQLKKAVDHVVANFSGDTTVFDAANTELQNHLQAMAHKAEVGERRHVEAARGREKLDLAKLGAGKAVATAVGGATLPKFQKSLLEQAWADVLTLILLRHGEESDEWTRHLQATSEIVDALTGKAVATDQLGEQIRQALGLVGYQGQEATDIARHLTATGNDSDADSASQTELAIKLKARARVGGTAPQAAQDKPRTAREQACYEHLRTLSFGSWIEFAKNQQGDMVRRRLAWFSPTTGHALFVNQRGQRVNDTTGPGNLDQVARQMAAGQARVVPVDQPRLVDRAWHATLTALRGLTGRGGKAPKAATGDAT